MSFFRLTLLVSGLFTATTSSAATPKEIDAAVQKGAGYLKKQYADPKAGLLPRGTGVGETALAGLALLESGTAIDDPAVKVITELVRDAAFTETRTYHIALCLLYLDRLGDPADVPVIQMLGIRLLAGQNERGGWSYGCIDSVPAADERRLRNSLMFTELKSGEVKAPAAPAKKGVQPAIVGRLHPELVKYAGLLAAIRRFRGDDNSNTQFGILGVWAARKHGVPVEHALTLIEARFLTTQTPGGGWPYSGVAQGSESMTCAGLLGLATAIGRREERRLKADIGAHQDNPFAKPRAKEPAKSAPKNNDPFYNPPVIPKSDDPFFNPAKPPEPPVRKKGAPKLPHDLRDAAVQRGLEALGEALAGNAAPVKGRRNRIDLGGALGNRDFYFLWSLERVGVVYGLDKIAGIDWYDAGAEALIPAQLVNGSWGGGGNGAEVDTSFALLFLARSNLVRDLSNKVQKDGLNAELRAGAGPVRKATAPAPAVKPPAVEEPTAAKASAPKGVAAKLISAGESEWPTLLGQIRDAKGGEFTQGLVLAIHSLEGDRRKSARDALAERLTRMTAATLRTMAKDSDAELRRGAVLAMAMKDDKAHLPDLVSALLDEEEIVIRAAKAGLKSASGQDFGPAAGASLAERTAAAKMWLQWVRKQK